MIDMQSWRILYGEFLVSDSGSSLHVVYVDEIGWTICASSMFSHF